MQYFDCDFHILQFLMNLIFVERGLLNLFWEVYGIKTSFWLLQNHFNTRRWRKVLVGTTMRAFGSIAMRGYWGSLYKLLVLLCLEFSEAFWTHGGIWLVKTSDFWTQFYLINKESNADCTPNPQRLDHLWKTFNQRDFSSPFQAKINWRNWEVSHIIDSMRNKVYCY